MVYFPCNSQWTVHTLCKWVRYGVSFVNNHHVCNTGYNGLSPRYRYALQPLIENKMRDPFQEGFSIRMQIWWRHHSTLIKVVVKGLLRNFVHDTTTVLSWHVQNLSAIWYITMELHKPNVPLNLNHGGKKRSWNGPQFLKVCAEFCVCNQWYLRKHLVQNLHLSSVISNF